MNLLDYAELYGLDTNLKSAIYHLERENSEKIENLETEKHEQMKAIRYLYSYGKEHHSNDRGEEVAKSE